MIPAPRFPAASSPASRPRPAARRIARYLAALALAALGWMPAAAAQQAPDPAPEESPPVSSEPLAGEPGPGEPGAGEPGPGASAAGAPPARRFQLVDPEPGRAPWAPREWALSAGVFDLAKTDRAEAGLELRFAPWRVRLFERDWRLEPMLFAMVNEDGGWYGHLGLRLPIELGERWRATPFFGPGIYSAGDGLDLGGPVEFRSGLEISARLGERVSVGVSYYHLSNGILYDLNPGQESLVLVLALRPGGRSVRADGAGDGSGAGR